MSGRHFLILSLNISARGEKPRGVIDTQIVQYYEYAKIGPSNIDVCKGRGGRHTTHLNTIKFQKKKTKPKPPNPKTCTFSSLSDPADNTYNMPEVLPRKSIAIGRLYFTKRIV